MLCVKDGNYKSQQNTIVMLGKFDGIHKGHRKLFEAAADIRQKENLPIVVFSFKVADGLHYDYMDGRHITTFPEREIMFERLGADVFIEYPFDDAVAGMEPLKFIEDIIHNMLNASYVIVGDDWTFGRGGEGNCDLLKASQKLFNFTAVIMEKELYDGREICSTWIREEMSKGNMENANILLGYPFTIIGEVVHGNEFGRTMGFPTANIIPPEDKLLSPNGVYASKIIIDGTEYCGVTNVGVKPTVEADGPLTVETFIIDFYDDIYGKTIEVQLIHFQRPEMKFADSEMLKKQLSQDIEFAKSYFLL
ncbi:MAG: riboflavin biosynthesis protein RibF [Butyrivibrio sp.]